MSTQTADGLPLVIVVFWRRVGTSVEFLTPPLGIAYLEAMSHQTNRDSSVAARQWVTHKFGFNPRSNARVIPAIAAHVVAFAPTQAELNRMPDNFVWVPAASLEVAAIFGLQHAAQRL